jgi:hypothetical protein
VAALLSPWRGWNPTEKIAREKNHAKKLARHLEKETTESSSLGLSHRVDRALFVGVSIVMSVVPLAHHFLHQ